LIGDRENDNTFQNLSYNFYNFRTDFDTSVTRHTRSDQDDLIVALLIRLRRMSLFKKEDIRDYHLVTLSCAADELPERMLQFLVEWDPTSLVQTNILGWLPLHYAARTQSIQEFQIAFGYGIRYYPFKKGITLLFQKNNEDNTPFQFACQKYGRDEVMNAVDATLARYSQETPLNSVEALMVAAADENIHLDCSYFLLRREPDVLVRLLPLGPDDNNSNGGGVGNNDDGNDSNSVSDGKKNDGDNADDENDNDEGGDEDEDVGNYDGKDVDNDDGGDEGGIGDSTNNGTGTRKRKRRVRSID